MIIVKRNIYQSLLDWKTSDKVKPLIVFGARQVGKSYIIDQFCKNEFKKYVSINLLEDDRLISLFKEELTSDAKFLKLQSLLEVDLESEDTVLFIDEVQESEELISYMKYICEKHSKVRIICAGSLLGVKLQRTRISFPVGKVKMLTLYPMDFEEFLLACGREKLIDEIKSCYSSNRAIGSALHNTCLEYYRIYNVCGGMPEVVLDLVNKDLNYALYDRCLINDIVDSYLNDMSKYVLNVKESLKIKSTYLSVPSQISNESKKFQYSKIESGARSRNYDTAIDWLVASNMIFKSTLVNAPVIPLKATEDFSVFKVFVSDIGILNTLLEVEVKDIVTDNLSLYKGSVAENYVANQLYYNGRSIHFWKNGNTAEVDFLIYNQDGIIPIEVKAGVNTQSKSLNEYVKTFDPLYSIRVSAKDFGYNEEQKIKSVPLYAVFCIK